MTKRKTAADRLIERLSGDDAAYRERALSTLIQFALDQPVAAYLHIDETVQLIALAITGPNTTRSIERHMRPGWERNLARCEETQDTLGNAIPEDVRARIPRLILENRPPKSEWAKNAVDPKLLRELLSPVLQEFLLGFARKLPIPGKGGGHAAPAEETSRSGFGLRNRLKQEASKRAEKFVEAGKTVLGGLSAEVERQIQTAVKDFSASAEEDIRKALMDRLRSDEGKDLLRQIVEQAVGRVLDTPLAEMNKDAEALPWDDIWALIPPIAEHNRDRDHVVAAIRDELEAVLKVEGERSARDLLEESGLLDDMVAAVLQHADTPAQAFFGSAEFDGLVRDLLK
ncbi:MAG: hypothetical protein ACJAYU_002477 [Bradymonadia bacterium]|jgi:hypothetical protein